MATSKEKLAEIKAKKDQELAEKAETIAMQKLYASKHVFDNSKNKTMNADERPAKA